MHSRLELLFICEDEKKARGLCEAVEAEVSGMQKVFDRHDAESPVSALNSATGRVGVCDELFFALEMCEQFRKLTEGYFDVTALSKVASSYRMFPESHEVELSEGCMVDFGGFAKGYALDSIRRILSEGGIKAALVNFGNSSVLAMGKHPFGPCWKVRSEDGGKEFELVDSSFSLSGRSRSGADHIVDPHSASPAAPGPWVAVTGRSALVCEILSTALYAAPMAVRDRIIESFDGYRITYGS